MPLRDILTCKKVFAWYCSSSYYYFEIFYKSRQIYRVNSLENCNKWIDNISSAIIYHNFWISILDKYSYLENYLLRQKYEDFEINQSTEIIDIKDIEEDNKNTKITNKYGSGLGSQSENSEKDDKKSKKKRKINPFSQKGKNLI